jgi:hypothetical protein
VKTFLVRDGHGESFMGNAETPEEIVLYAIARTGMDAAIYVVYDHDLNRYEVARPQPPTG